MKRVLIAGLSLFMLLAVGCGAQELLLGTKSSYLFSASDALVLPGEQTPLRTKVQGGDFLSARPGCVVRFYRDGKLFKAAETDDDGVASVWFRPDSEGDHTFTVELASTGLEGNPPEPQTLLVAARSAQQNMVIVDLDKTVVASGFHTVLIGEPSPMEGSAELLRQLARTYTIVYLTHRPDYFGPKSKAWLGRYDFPKGPLLLAGSEEFFKGSGTYKAEALRKLRQRFENIKIGIGDKVSDALAYSNNSMRAFLIVQIPQTTDPAPFELLADRIATLPEDVQVVTGWDQIEKAIFGGTSFGRGMMEDHLRQLARDRIQAAQQEALNPDE